MILDNMVEGIPVNSSEFVESFWELMPSPFIEGLGLIINIAKIAGILVIIYLIFLIVKALFRARAMRDVRKTAKGIVEISGKLDRIIYLLEGKHKDKKEKRKKKK